VDPRSGLDDVEKRKFLTLPGLELRPLGLPTRRQSLYRIRYPGCHFPCRFEKYISAGKLFGPVNSSVPGSTVDKQCCRESSSSCFVLQGFEFTETFILNGFPVSLFLCGSRPKTFSSACYCRHLCEQSDDP
jgi:hypothetical protein